MACRKCGAPTFGNACADGHPTTITCPRCGRTSHNPNDAIELYCGACHWWTSDPALAGINPADIPAEVTVTVHAPGHEPVQVHPAGPDTAQQLDALHQALTDALKKGPACSP